MKFFTLKYFLLFLIILIINNAVLCQEDDKDESNIQSVTGNNPETPSSTDQVKTPTPIDNDDKTTEPPSSPSPTPSPTPAPVPTTTKITTTNSPSPTPKKEDKQDDSSKNKKDDDKQNNNVPPQDQQQNQQQDQQQNQPQDQQQNQQQNQQQEANSQATATSNTNNPLGTIGTGNSGENKKDDDSIPIGYILLGIALVAIIVAAVIGFAIAVQKKKKNNEQLAPNIWSVPDDFDSRVITPIAPPANTYNVNNAPISQQPMTQPYYGQAQVMSDAYNQPMYDQNVDMQLPPNNGVAVPIDNSYSDYSNGQANNEYIPTSIDELKVNNVYVSQFTFQPELDDEIEINIDDQIYIEEIFADNWALGVNTTNNARGCFPLNIFLNPKSTLDNSRSQRTLSYCSSGNGAAY